MKFIDRTRVPIPASLDNQANSPANLELALAQQHYVSGATKTYDFKVYKETDVKAALDNLFNKHCAYCESYFGATQPQDIEHFRPKGKVLEEPTHRGYWWLAANWENLLSSCIDCNRRRTHQVLIYDQNLGLINRYEALEGKGESFPVYANRASNIGEEIHEVPLLVCPTSEEPSQFLSYQVINDLALVTLTTSSDNLANLKGKATIKCFGLNRQGLVDKRTALARKIQLMYARVEEIFDKAAMADNQAVRDALISVGSSQLDSVEREIEAYQEYSVFASEYSKFCLDKLVAKYQSFLAPENGLNE